MNNYKATFANGAEIVLTTKRVCSVAYRISCPAHSIYDEPVAAREVTGFSLSEKAALAAVGNLVSRPPKRDVSKAAEQVRQANAKFLAGCKIEIVAAQSV